MTLEELIKKWILDNYGQAEANNPAYDIKALADYLDKGFQFWDNDITDSIVYKTHNCFKTREEVQQARDLWLAERELRSFSDGGVWGIYRKRGEFIPYNDPDHILSGYRFPTFEETQEAIKKLGEDKLKLIFGVK